MIILIFLFVYFVVVYRSNVWATTKYWRRWWHRRRQRHNGSGKKKTSATGTVIMMTMVTNTTTNSYDSFCSKYYRLRCPVCYFIHRIFLVRNDDSLSAIFLSIDLTECVRAYVFVRVYLWKQRWLCIWFTTIFSTTKFSWNSSGCCCLCRHFSCCSFHFCQC